MYTIYILKSLKNGKKYVGFTSKPLQTRIAWHRDGLTQWTRTNSPFELIYSEKHENKSKAARREKYFKTGQGRRTLGYLLEKNPGSISAIKHGGPATLFGGSSIKHGGPATLFGGG